MSKTVSPTTAAPAAAPALPTTVLTMTNLLASLPMVDEQELSVLGITLDGTDPANLKFKFSQTVHDAYLLSRLTFLGFTAGGGGGGTPTPPVTAGLRMLTAADLATGNGSDGQAYTLNVTVDANGTSSAVDPASVAAARYNLKLPAGVDGFACFKVVDGVRSPRLLFRTSLLRPAGPSYQVRRGIRMSYSNQPQTVSGDGTGNGTDANFAAVAAGTYLFMSREGTAIKYYNGTLRDGSNKVLIAGSTDTDPTNSGDLWLASGGEAGAGTLTEVYTSGFVAFGN